MVMIDHLAEGEIRRILGTFIINGKGYFDFPVTIKEV